MIADSQLSSANGARPRNVWASLGAAFVVALASLFTLYWPTAASIEYQWSHSANFAHGYLILAIVLWLVWRQRATLQTLVPQTEWRGLPVLLLLSMVWLVADIAEINAAKQMAWVAMIPTLVWTILGREIFSHLLFPLGYLFFGVPFGEFLIPPLQDVTAAFTVNALQLINIPVLVEGRFFLIPSGSFEVADACSGTRYLISSVALGTLFAYLNFHALWRRVLFVLFAAVFAIIANGVRAFSIVMLAHLSDHQIAVGFDHIVYGWVFFFVLVLSLFWVGAKFRDDVIAVPVAAALVRAVPGTSPLHLMGMVVSVGVLLFIAPLMARTVYAITDLPPSKIVLPEGIGGWRGPLSAQDAWEPVFPGASDTQRGEYRREQTTVYVFTARYAGRTEGGQQISVANSFFDPTQGRRIAEQELTVTLPAQEPLPIHATQITWQQAPRLLWHWYEIGGHPVIRPLQFKIRQTRARLLRADTSSSVVILSTVGEQGVDQPDALLREFLGAMGPALRRAVETAP